MARGIVIDDDPGMKKLIKDILEQKGHEITTASDGIEGLKVIRRELPDFIISDKNMPGLTGFQVAEEMKKDPRLAKIPIIIASSDFGEEDEKLGRTYAKAYGVAAVIPKDSLRYLTETVDRVLASRS